MPLDPHGDYLSIDFGGGHVGVIPVPDELAELMVGQIVPTLTEFTDHVITACRHPGSPCQQCRLEVINGAWAFMQKAAARLHGG